MSELISWMAPDGTMHEECTLQFFVGGTKLGECLFDPGHAASLGWRRSGLCYFCGFCGSIWGRMTLLNSKGVPQHYEVIAVACKDHPDRWQTPGSFLARELSPIVKFLPPEVAKWELALRGEAVGS